MLHIMQQYMIIVEMPASLPFIYERGLDKGLAIYKALKMNIDNTDWKVTIRIDDGTEYRPEDLIK